MNCAFNVLARVPSVCDPSISATKHTSLSTVLLINCEITEPAVGMSAGHLPLPGHLPPLPGHFPSLKRGKGQLPVPEKRRANICPLMKKCPSLKKEGRTFAPPWKKRAISPQSNLKLYLQCHAPLISIIIFCVAPCQMPLKKIKINYINWQPLINHICNWFSKPNRFVRHDLYLTNPCCQVLNKLKQYKCLLVAFLVMDSIILHNGTLN